MNYETVKAVLGRKLPEFFLFFAFAMFNAIVVYCHEPWRDEADAWLFARDSTWAGGWDFLRHAGTPGLWYVLLAPLAKMGLPYFTLALVNLVIINLCMLAIIWASPFLFVEKALIVFSYFSIFEYGVVARSYALSFLIIVVLTVFAARRRGSPVLLGFLVALVANTNAYGAICGLAFLVSFFFDYQSRWAKLSVRQRRAGLIGLALACSGGTVAVLSVLPPEDPQFAPFVAVSAFGKLDSAFKYTLWMFSQGIFPVFEQLNYRLLCLSIMLFAAVTWKTGIVKMPGLLYCLLAVLFLLVTDWAEGQFVLYGSQVRTLLSASVSLLLVVLAIYAGRYQLRVLLFTSVFVVAFTLFGVFLCVPSVRHSGFVFVVLLVTLWLLCDSPPFCLKSKKALRSIFVFSLCCSVVTGVRTAWDDIWLPFSGSRQAAEFLRTLDLESSVLAAHAPWAGEAVLPYLPVRQFWYPGHNSFGSHMPWNRNYIQGAYIQPEDAARRVLARFPHAERIILVFNGPISNADKLAFQLLFVTDELRRFKGDERYFIYQKLNKG